MQTIQHFFTGWMTTFQQQNVIGKVLLLLLSFSFLCCICIFPLAILDPSFSTSSTPTIDVVKLQEQVLQTVIAGITQTEQAIPSSTSTQTLSQTQTVVATDTNLPTETRPPSLSLVGASCIPSSDPQIGKVIEVVDGDTIRVALEDGLFYSVRYIGIDTPENTSAKEYFGQEASTKNAELILGKTLLLYRDVSETDRYGRLLRYVVADDVFVNYELVAQGYATQVSYPPDTACEAVFKDAQQSATTSQLGIWAAPTPTLPPLPSGSGGVETQVCLCSGNAYNCADFSTHADAQACYTYCISKGAGDVHRLDSDSDGSACESLP